MSDQAGRVVKKVEGFLRFQLTRWAVFSLAYLFILVLQWGNVGQGVVMVLVMLPTYLLISTGLRAVYLRPGLPGRFGAETVLFVSAGVLASASLQVGYSLVTVGLVESMAGAPERHAGLATRFIFQALVFGGWSLAYLWWRAEKLTAEEEARRMEAMVSAERAELQMLRYQLNPHFLVLRQLRMTLSLTAGKHHP